MQQDCTASGFISLLKTLCARQESVVVFSVAVEPFVGRIAEVQSDYLVLRKADSDENGNTKFSLIYIQMPLVGGVEITESIYNSKEQAK